MVDSERRKHRFLLGAATIQLESHVSFFFFFLAFSGPMVQIVRCVFLLCFFFFPGKGEKIFRLPLSPLWSPSSFLFKPRSQMQVLLLFLLLGRMEAFPFRSDSIGALGKAKTQQDTLNYKIVLQGNSTLISGRFVWCERSKQFITWHEA